MLGILRNIINPADEAYYSALSQEEQQRQRALLRARAYHEGQQFVKLTDRLREFLKDPLAELDSDALRLNICRIVVTAVTERLLVKGFTTDSDQDAILWDWWQKNRMDARQKSVHTYTLRDSETFVIVSWDDERGIPRFVEHEAYTDANLPTRYGRNVDTTVYPVGYARGSGYGCTAHYPNDDMSLPMEYATKRWVERRYVNGSWESVNRLTVYHPDRIEKYQLLGGTRVEYEDPGDGGWPLPWIDGAGEPLGIPVIHFRNEDDKPEALEAIPMQNGINKTLIDALMSSDSGAFPNWFAKGFIPTTDGRPLAADNSNQLVNMPGAIIATLNKDAELTKIPGSDVKPILDTVNQLIYWAAMATDTPVNRFISTKAIASDETMKGQDGALINKIRSRQALIGNGWEDCMTMARRLYNTFGDGGLDDTLTIATQWHPAESRDEQKVIDTIATKRDSLDIPIETAWAEAGYTPEQIDKMQRARDEAQRKVLATSAMMPITNDANGSGNAGDIQE